MATYWERRLPNRIALIASAEPNREGEPWHVIEGRSQGIWADCLQEAIHPKHLTFLATSFGFRSVRERTWGRWITDGTDPRRAIHSEHLEELKGERPVLVIPYKFKMIHYRRRSWLIVWEYFFSEEEPDRPRESLELARRRISRKAKCLITNDLRVACLATAYVKPTLID